MWTFTHESGKPWRGLFIAAQRPDLPRRYIVQAQAEWIEEVEDDA